VRIQALRVILVLYLLGVICWKDIIYI